MSTCPMGAGLSIDHGIQLMLATLSTSGKHTALLCVMWIKV